MAPRGRPASGRGSGQGRGRARGRGRGGGNAAANGKKVIPNSSPMPSSDDVLESSSSRNLRSKTSLKAASSGTFGGVLIPPKSSANASAKMTPRTIAPDSLSSGSNLQSPISRSRESSVEYQTPDTSAPGTTAGSTAGAKKSGPSSKALGKRRMVHSTPAPDTSGDADLALSMQFAEEANNDDEYDDDDVPIMAASSKRKSRTAAPELQPKKKFKPSSSSTFEAKPRRPQRKARASAEQAMSVGVSILHDSEESPLSELDSEFKTEPEAASPLFSDSEASQASNNEDEVSASGSVPLLTFEPSRLARRRHQWRETRAQRERKKLEKAHPEVETMWDELRAKPLITPKEAKQPLDITRQLKGFQLEGLNWMKKQEQTEWKGGLLGDEMGMGKTIQAVSLIMSDYPAKNPTLVVVPPVALVQWTNEINDYTDGKLKVLFYHGTNAKAKKMPVRELKKYDVILISYSSLESIHRKETKGWDRGEDLVKEDSAIHAIHYHRLILDEAHSIKSRTTGVAKACFALTSDFKWCMSGTPVQNRIGEFFSLLRFLEVKPFANYFCKTCACSSLHWSTDASHRCTHCGHRSFEHVSMFNQEILNPIISAEAEEDSRKAAFEKLRLLTDHIMLRRMKRDYTASMELPPKEIVSFREFFGEVEKDFASSIMGNTARQFDTYVSRGVMLNNYANIFGLIMQMRQVSDHPDMITKKHSEEGQNVLVCHLCDEPAEDAIRSRCKHDFCRACVKDFVKSCDASDAVADCPRCHIALSIDFDQPAIEQDTDLIKQTSIINRIKMENWTSSTKIEMLVYELWKLRSPKRTTKSIVFSQFTSMLQLVEWRLRRAGFHTVMLDGSMSPAQRQKSIEYFLTNSDVEVFLVSLKAGGVALNLTEASRVFLIDPWWNPAAESQSADRCHRIGQKRPCVVTRLVVEDSIESRIVALQEKKAHMIRSTVDKDDVAMDKLTPDDMQFLFRGS